MNDNLGMLLMSFRAALVLATVLCTLVAGFLFAFATVVMPGLRSLDDGAFIRAFQVVDRVIQKRQPLFGLVWVGSVLAALAAAGLGFWALPGVERLLAAAPAIVYLLGVQVPTMTINVPLNDQLQTLDVANMTEATRRRARQVFEPRWNRWNVIRTGCASLVSVLFALLLARL